MSLDRRALLTGLGAALLAPERAQAAAVTDSAGRPIPVPARVERVFPAGPPAAVMLYTLAPYNQLPAMTFWLLGSLSATTAPDLIPLLGPIALGALVLIALRWRMNVMSLPEEEARALGVATGWLRVAIIAAATLVTSASVAAAGIIGWVGLVGPHLARSLVGPDFARLLPASAILGGGYLLLIDTLARTLAQVEIPLGILTAVIGTPFFIWLLASVQKNWS